ncbi:MAG: metal-dependent transcriptional regulator [candidate division WOR-3 bacterium]
MGLTGSREDYLEVICEICKKEKVARVKDIALRMGVSLPSVNYALTMLEKAGLIKHKKYGFIELTKEGNKTGKAISKKHQIIKEFLMNILKVNEKTAERDACKMEHVLSKETLNRMDFFLKTKGGENSYPY